MEETKQKEKEKKRKERGTKEKGREIKRRGDEMGWEVMKQKEECTSFK